MSNDKTEKSDEKQVQPDAEHENGSMPTIVFVLLEGLVAIIIAAVVLN